MTDKPTRPTSLSKGNGSAKTPAATPAKAKPNPPTFVKAAAAALVLSGLAAIGAALSLLGLKGWLRGSLHDSISDKLDDKYDDLVKAASNTGARKTTLDSVHNSLDQLRNTASDKLSNSRIDALRDQLNGLKATEAKKGDGLIDDLRSQLGDLKNLNHQVDLTVRSQLIATLVVLIAMSIIALSAYKGRYWARWGVLGLWVLSTFTGTLTGITSILSIAADQPVGFKVPAFLAGLLFLVAVVLTNLKPSTAYFNANRPERPARGGAGGARGGQRRGLFAPPAPRQAPEPEPEVKAAGPDRARTKQRATADSAAKGAELARARAKASKSRRSGV